MHNKATNTRVLFCSPRGFAGGIALWTEHILSHYKSIDNPSIELEWLYHKGKGKEVTDSTSVFRRIAKGICNYIPFLRDLNRKLKNNSYNLVHFSSSAGLSLIRDYLSVKIAHNHNVKAIIHFHFGRIPQILETQNWERYWLKKVVAEADGVIVLDKKSFYALKQNGYEEVFQLPNPLSQQILDQTRSMNVERKQRTILYVGHIVRTKGIIELIKACKGIQNIHLTIIGNGTKELIDEVKQTAGNNCDSWLTIEGVHPHAYIIQSMLKASVFVLPSYSEGFPNVILESMACGCAIVSTDVGAIPEMLSLEEPDCCGICVKPKQIVELREAIERMLDDNDFSTQCRCFAQNRVWELFSMPKVWEQLIHIWEEVSLY